MIYENVVLITMSLGHQEKKIRFEFEDLQPSQQDINDTIQSVILRVASLEKDNFLIKEQIKSWSDEFGRKLKFGFKNPDVSQIELSDDCQSAKKLKSDYIFVGVIGDAPVYSSGKTYFEIVINSATTSCNIMVGYVSKNETYNQGYYTKPTGHMFYGCNGYFYRNSGCPAHLKQVTCKKDDRIGAVFDADQLKVTFYLNDEKLG